MKGVRAWETLLEFSSYKGTRQTRIGQALMRVSKNIPWKGGSRIECYDYLAND